MYQKKLKNVTIVSPILAARVAAADDHTNTRHRNLLATDVQLWKPSAYPRPIAPPTTTIAPPTATIADTTNSKVMHGRMKKYLRTRIKLEPDVLEEPENK